MHVSVIIPCFNVEDYIAECIESVRSQVYLDIEIICVDNNSTDKTRQIITEYSLKYPTKIIVSEELKKGAPAARNKGLSLAKGEWIQFLDADDLLLPEKIDHQIKTINNNEELAFISGAYFRQSIDGKKSAVKMTETDGFKAVFASIIGVTSANLFNAAKIKEINGWNEHLLSSQEADLMFRLLKKGHSMQFDNLELSIIRERESGQISQRNPIEKWLLYIDLRAQMLNYLKESNSTYFKKEREYYNYKLYIAIKTLAKYDINIAAELFHKHLNRQKIKNIVGGTSLYIWVLNVFGFKVAEKLNRKFNK